MSSLREYGLTDYLSDMKSSLCMPHTRILVLRSTHRVLRLAYPYEFVLGNTDTLLLQIQITGSGTRYPTSFVAFPGAYTASTPGIVYDVYTNTSAYPIPGPTLYVHLIHHERVADDCLDGHNCALALYGCHIQGRIAGIFTSR